MTGYDTDLSNKEWQIIQPLFPRKKKTGRVRSYPMKEVVNAILYVVRTGCAWRLLPNDLPPKSTVYGYFRGWVKDGLWEGINDKLRKKVREKEGRDADPSAAIIDSQSVKMCDQAGVKGYDGGKKIKGRKRHVLVDVLGLLIAVKVTAASFGDRKGAEFLFEKMKNSLPRLEKIWADGGYTGPLQTFVEKTFGWILEIIKPIRDKGPGFHVRPWCWRVERTLGWLNKNRRLSKDYEVLEATSEALIQISMIRIMLRRLA